MSAHERQTGIGLAEWAFDAEKFIYWKDEFTLEFYAYKVIDRTTLLN